MHVPDAPRVPADASDHPTARPPVGAPRLSLVEELHGHSVADPYRWLEDAESPETLHWQEIQDQLWLNHTAGLSSRFRLRTQVKNLSAVGSTSAPIWRGEHCFVLRQAATRNTQFSTSTTSRCWIPSNSIPTGSTTLDSWQPSPDGSLLAFQVSRGGTEQSSLYVLDVQTGELVDGPIDGCRYSPVAWLPDGKSFYYVRFRQVLRHRVGSADDVQVLPGEASYGLELSADGRWLAISAVRGSANDLWLADLSKDQPPTVLQQGVDAITLASVGPDGRLYVVTTRDAPTGRILRRRSRRSTGLARLRAGRSRGTAEQSRDPRQGRPGRPDPARARRDRRARPGHRPSARRRPAARLRLGRLADQSPRRRPRSLVQLHRQRHPGRDLPVRRTHRPDDALVRPHRARSTGRTPRRHELEYRSADGTVLRMLVIAKPGAGPRPTILYGYGGFGQSLTPTYSAFTLAWVEAGGVFVTANLRGGGEGGDEWHRAGTLGPEAEGLRRLHRGRRVPDRRRLDVE